MSWTVIFEVLSGTRRHRPDLNAQIVREVYIALKRLGAGPELVAASSSKCARGRGEWTAGSTPVLPCVPVGGLTRVYWGLGDARFWAWETPVPHGSGADSDE